MKKDKRGGKRAGAGRPKKAETKTVSFRVKLNQVDPIKIIVNKYITLQHEKITFEFKKEMVRHDPFRRKKRGI